MRRWPSSIVNYQTRISRRREIFNIERSAMATATQPVNAQAMASRRAKIRSKFGRRAKIASALRAASGRGEIPQLGFGQYFIAADAIGDAADEAKDDDLDLFINDCCENQGDGVGFSLFEQKVSAKLAAAGASSILDIIAQLLPVLLPLLLSCFGA